MEKKRKRILFILFVVFFGFITLNIFLFNPFKRIGIESIDFKEGSENAKNDTFYISIDKTEVVSKIREEMEAGFNIPFYLKNFRLYVEPENVASEKDCIYVLFKNLTREFKNENFTAEFGKPTKISSIKLDDKLPMSTFYSLEFEMKFKNKTQLSEREGCSGDLSHKMLFFARGSFWEAFAKWLLALASEIAFFLLLVSYFKIGKKEDKIHVDFRECIKRYVEPKARKRAD